MLAKLNHVSVTSFVLALVGSIAYHAICEGFHGSSLGKLIFSMVVVQEDGSPCRPDSALIRSVAFLVDGLFLGVVGYMAMERTAQEQRYEDEWAHTIVCKRSDPPRASLRSNGRFTAVFFVALLVDISFVMIALVMKITG